MDCEEIGLIQQKLQLLYDALSQTMPVAHIKEHPFAYNSKTVHSIIEHIAELAMQAAAERARREAENKELEERLVRYCEQLGLPCRMPERTDNVNLQQELFENELRRVMQVRNQVGAELMMLEGEIREIEAWLGIEANSEMAAQRESVATGAVVSLKALNSLRSELSRLNEERARKEAMRQDYYDEISAVAMMLKRTVEFTNEEGIGALEQLRRVLNAELEANKIRAEELMMVSKKYEDDLEMEHREFGGDLDSVSIAEMEAYVTYLKEEQARLFSQIFYKAKAELDEISKIFGLPIEDYGETEDSLERMREKIRTLLPKKGLFTEISELIEKRRLLLQKMTEFEKIASDPKRLFKSSFQLNTEERFRNTAYPSLLKLEENIFERIDEYETEFGTFYRDGESLRMLLRLEIDNRIINRTVFISRSDSPYRKRK